MLGFFYEQSPGNYLTDTVTLNMKTIDKEQGLFFNSLSQGAPVFDKSGDLLGLYNGIDPDSKIKTINSYSVIDALIHFKEKMEIKRTAEIPLEQFKKELYTNLVLIKAI